MAEQYTHMQLTSGMENRRSRRGVNGGAHFVEREDREAEEVAGQGLRL